ncbi:hypothetical protein [Bacillus sp. AFS019443]|uniref:hypothetical protein n=1 Tax=Bacillus sp. AFS019443 TaxID=2034279 RepID=UPI000BF76223|nr:hypothetical protein [Bacillus sp. AFS019443]PEU16120.1 hypothetical protein CN524_05100 [Bacillus sp. AFS019443]
MGIDWGEIFKNYSWVFAVLATFTGASIAQVVNYRFTLKKDEKQYDRECYQNLYSPIIYKVLVYYDVKTIYRKDQLRVEFKEDEIFEEILELFSKNLKYATPNLISLYEAVKERDIYEDLSGQRNVISEIEFCFELLRESAKNAKSLGIKDISNQFMKYRMLYGIWLVVARYYDYSVGVQLMRREWAVETKINKKKNKKMLKIISKTLDKSFPSLLAGRLYIAKNIVFKIWGAKGIEDIREGYPSDNNPVKVMGQILRAEGASEEVLKKINL